MGPRAFHRAFETYRDPVFRFLLRLCRARTEAEDLLQDTFASVWRKRAQWPGEDANVLAWLRKIAFRLYLNHRTKATRRAALFEGYEPRPSDDDVGKAVTTRDEEAFLVRRVQVALRDLTDEQRETFVLHRFEGLTCREIAELMDQPLKTIESRLRRATRAIAERLRTRLRDASAR